MISSPLRIAEVETGPSGGRIGITLAPGKKQADALSGHHDRDLCADLDVIAAWNAAAVITLVESSELNALQIPDLGEQVRRRFMEWHHWPIADVSTPNAAFEAAWPARSAQLRSLLAAGANILIHCKGGLGRAGMVAARLLVEMGADPSDAISTVRAVRPGAIETHAQEIWVSRGRTAALPVNGRDFESIRDRAIGALVGLAVGDAVGTTIEFRPKLDYPLVYDMVGGGPFRLTQGEWTDDTAMALALVDSLATVPDLDPSDLMSRFVDWYDSGTYSCTGTCFDIGTTIRGALERFRRTGDPLAGSTDPRQAGNGALMRLSPVAIRHWNDRSKLHDVARLQTRTTHGADEAVDASIIFADLIADAIAGAPLPAILASPSAQRIEGGWRGLHRDEIRGSGYVVHALQAAVWAVARTTSFRSAILLAANLGEDADTTAAIAGQLAGAVYGLSGIPQEWLERLAWRQRIVDSAERLFALGMSGEQRN